MAIAGCGDSSSGDGAGASASAGAASDTKVGLAYDIGGRGDQSFNDSAAKGLDQAKTELGVQSKELEAANGETDAQKEERLRLLAEGGFNPIFAVGFAYAAPLAKVAKEFPEVKFAIVDSTDAKASNIANLVFAEEQGSFLVGAAAALTSKKGDVGFVGGVDVPLIRKFLAGYTAGVKQVKAADRVQAKYLSQPPDFSGFGDPAKGRTAAQGQLDAGADVIYQAAGGSGSGVFEAVKGVPGTWAIGVDSDQALTADPSVRDIILTSMVKNVNVAVFDYIKSFTVGQAKSGEIMYDLAVGGVGYSTTGGHIDALVPALDQLKERIISGQIKVPTG